MPYTYDHPRPSVTVDMVVFTIYDLTLHVLLIERRSEPFAGAWALPGGFVRVHEGKGVEGGERGESLEEAAYRELEEETNLERRDVFLEQLYTFGRPDRDPRGRVISVAHYALVSADLLAKVKGGDDAAAARWFPAETARRKRLAFDHREILGVALRRLRGKIDYEPRIAVSLVPREFTQAELRRVFEVIKGRAYDRGNFSKRFRRMQSDGWIVPGRGRRILPGAGRPPKLYSFRGR